MALDPKKLATDTDQMPDFGSDLPNRDLLDFLRQLDIEFECPHCFLQGQCFIYPLHPRTVEPASIVLREPWHVLNPGISEKL